MLRMQPASISFLGASRCLQRFPGLTPGALCVLASLSPVVARPSGRVCAPALPFHASVSSVCRTRPHPWGISSLGSGPVHRFPLHCQRSPSQVLQALLWGEGALLLVSGSSMGPGARLTGRTLGQGFKPLDPYFLNETISPGTSRYSQHFETWRLCINSLFSSLG